MFSYKLMPARAFCLALLFCLICPFVTFVEAAAGDSGITSVSNDFITIFGKAINTPKADNTSSVPVIPKAAEPLAELKDQVSTMEVTGSEGGSKDMKAPGPLFRIAHSLDVIIIVMVFILLFTIWNLALAAFSFNSTKSDLKHYYLINSQVKNHKWLTLIAGLLNGGVLVLLTLLLIKKMPLIGLILLAWDVGVILQVMAAEILSRAGGLNCESFNGEDSAEDNIEEEIDTATTVLSYGIALKLTLCQLSIYLIPVYGQLEFLKIIIRGIGAKVLLKTGFGRKTEQSD